EPRHLQHPQVLLQLAPCRHLSPPGHRRGGVLRGRSRGGPTDAGTHPREPHDREETTAGRDRSPHLARVRVTGPEDGWLASRIRKRYRPAPLMSSREHAFPMLKTRRLPRPAPLAAALLLCAAPAAAQGAGADTAGRSI